VCQEQNRNNSTALRASATIRYGQNTRTGDRRANSSSGGGPGGDWTPAALSCREAPRVAGGYRSGNTAIGCRRGRAARSGGIRSGLRSIVTRPYVVFYRIDQQAAQIVRVLDGRRDLDEIFTDEPPA